MRSSPSHWRSATRPSRRAPASCWPRGALARCRTSTSGSTGRGRRATKPGIALGCSIPPRPAAAGLRNLGPHGLDMFLHLTGEEAQVTGAQLSRRAHERPVEDYASVMLRSASGILGTVEVDNGFPRDGTDGEWKIAGRDAILTMKDGIMKLATADGDETLPGTDVTAPYFVALRDALDHWRRGEPPPISVHDCTRAVRLIDQASSGL